MKLEAKRFIWFLNFLVIILAVLMVISFIYPWWAADYTVEGANRSGRINIYAHGVHPNYRNIEENQYLLPDITPSYQVNLAWTYLGLSVAFAFIGIWLKGKRGIIILGVIGAAYLTYALIAAFAVISSRLSELGIPFHGTGTTMIRTAYITFNGGLQPCYYLACFIGLAYIILTFLKIILIKRYYPAIKE